MARRHANTVQNPIVAKIYLIIFGIIFALVPLCSILPIAFEDQIGNDDGAYEIVDAEISNIEITNKLKDTHYYVFVEYEYNGKKYNNIQLDRYDSTMYEGKEIEIKVDITNPENIKGVGVMGQPNYILLLAALPFLIFGIVIVIVGIKYDPSKKRPKGYGRYETPSEFSGMQSETNYRNNTYGMMNSQSDNVYGSMNSQSNGVYGTMNSQSNGVYGTMNSQSNGVYGTMNSQNNSVYGSMNSSNDDNFGFDNFGNNDDFFGNSSSYGNAAVGSTRVIKNNKELLKTGKCITGVVEKIENNTDFRGDAFLKVYCTCYDLATNTSYRYSSEDIPVSEGIDSTVVPGGRLEVYVNPNNMGEYYVSVPRDNRINTSPSATAGTNINTNHGSTVGADVNTSYGSTASTDINTNYDTSSSFSNDLFSNIDTSFGSNIDTSFGSNIGSSIYTSMDSSIDSTIGNSMYSDLNAYSSLNENTSVSVTSSLNANTDNSVSENKSNNTGKYASLDAYSKGKANKPKSLEEMYNSRTSL